MGNALDGPLEDKGRDRPRGSKRAAESEKDKKDGGSKDRDKSAKSSKLDMCLDDLIEPRESKGKGKRPRYDDYDGRKGDGKGKKGDDRRSGAGSWSFSSSKGKGKNDHRTMSCRIRVANIPRQLHRRDVRDAFSCCGEVRDCEVEGSVAFVTFGRIEDAKKAVQTFDQGEMNGKIIFVTH